MSLARIRPYYNFVLIVSIFSGLVAAASLASWKASAATLTVTTTADEYDLTPNGTCSLREAIQALNTGAAFGGCGDPNDGNPTTISIPAGTYTLTIVGKNENLNATGDLDILHDVIIQGSGAATTIISGNDSSVALADRDRVMQITDSLDVEIRDVTIRDGYLEKLDAPTNYTGWIYGGGILGGDGVSLTLTNCIVTNNRLKRQNSEAFGGGISLSDDDTALILDHTLITQNYIDIYSTGSGTHGGRAAGVSIEQVWTTYPMPAALGNDFVCDTCSITENVATANGSLVPSSWSSGFVEGVGLEVVTVRSFEMDRGQIDSNQCIAHSGFAQCYGVGLLLWEVSGPAVVAHITNSSFSENIADMVSIDAETQVEGIGIYTEIPVSIDRSDISNNGATGDTETSYAIALGGGIDIHSGNGSSITNSSINNNTFSTQVAYLDYLYMLGAGIHFENSADTITLYNNTISGNSIEVTYDTPPVGSAYSDVYGGGISNYGAATVNLSFNTIVNNSIIATDYYEDGEPLKYGSGYFDWGQTTYKGNVFDNDQDGNTNCFIDTLSAESEGYNIDSDLTCIIGFPPVGDSTDVHANSLVDDLSDNGGGLLTHALLVGSPAIDTAVSCSPAGSEVPLVSDERLYLRPVDGDLDGNAYCDSGAFEYVPPPADDEEINLSVDIEGPDDPVAPGDTVTYTITVTNGSAIAPDVELVYTNPGGTHITAYSFENCTITENELVCPLGDLDPDEVVVITVTLDLADNMGEGSLANDVVVRTESGDEAYLDDNTDSETTVVIDDDGDDGDDDENGSDEEDEVRVLPRTGEAVLGLMALGTISLAAGIQTDIMKKR